MNMFFGLTNSEPDDTGLESYEDVVENYFGALENLEDEIAGLEQLSDSMDNAEAFKRVIESGKATEALYDFGFKASEDFGELVGFSSLSSITMESMDSVGTFASESIKSKLAFGWEKVKDFIIRLWEKLKEFGRWIVGLFNRKRQRLEAIKKAATAKKAKAEKLEPTALAVLEQKLGKKESKTANIMSTHDVFNRMLVLKEIVTSSDVNVPPIISGLSEGTKLNEVIEKYFGTKLVNGLAKLGYKLDVMGRIVISGQPKREEKDLTGWANYAMIIDACTKCIELFEKKDAFVKYTKGLEDLAKFTTKTADETDKWQRDIDNEKKDKLDREETATKDYGRVWVIRAVRTVAISTSRLSVIVGKEINNIAACIIAVANVMGL